MAGKRWTAAEAISAALWVGRYRDATIARKLGRTPKAVRQWRERQRLFPSTQEWLTTSQAAELAGVSDRAMRRWARAGRVNAHRLPGGRRWLIDPASVPKASPSR